MAVTKEASDHLDRMLQHQKEVAAGVIPADSPVDFIRSDWKPGKGGRPGWFGPDWNPTDQAIESAAESQTVNQELAGRPTTPPD